MRAYIATLAAVLLAATSAQATTMTYLLTGLGGNLYEAEFTVANDTFAAPIEEFTVFFGLGAVDSLTISASPAGWDGIAIDPDPGIPDDGFADWLATGAPLGVGEVLGGFRVRLALLAATLPETLVFTIVDPVSFTTLETGRARLAGSSVGAEVPLPGAAVLLAAGMIGFVGAIRRRWSYTNTRSTSSSVTSSARRS